MIPATRTVWRCISACALVLLLHPSPVCKALSIGSGPIAPVPGVLPPMATVHIVHVDGVALSDGQWTLNNFLAFADDERLPTEADSLYHQRFPQGHIYSTQVPAEVTSIAFSTQDAQKFQIFVEGAYDSRQSPDEVINAVDWSNDRYRDGGEWTAADNNDETHWAYNTVTISHNPTAAFKRWSELPKPLATITITHLSGVAYHGEWSLNSLFAFAGNQLLTTDQDAALSQHQWFPQGHTVTIKVPANVDFIAFSTQDADKLFVQVQGAKDNRRAPARVINTVDWSDDKYRDGGRWGWTADDNEDPTHWAYNAVSISRSNPSSSYKSWSELPWARRRLLRSQSDGLYGAAQ